MSLGNQMILLLFATLALYLAVPGWFIFRGWILTAGLMQFVGAILPGLWQTIFCSDCAGNFYLLIIMLLPLPLALIFIGFVLALFRIGGRVLERARRGWV